VEFSPQANESVILKTFLNGIDPNCASIIYSRDIKNLREAYYTLQETGMTRNFKNKNLNKTNKNSDKPIQNQNSHNDNRKGYTPFRDDQVRYQSNQHSGQYRQNYNNNNFNNGNRNSGQFRQNRPEPMEVDHIERANQEEVNFQLPPQKRIYR